MEQAAAKTKAGQASPAGTFSMKLGKTTYVVGVHFSQTAKDTLEDKMKRLMKDDVKSSNFWCKIRWDIPFIYLDKTLPKGTILVECGKMLQRGTPKLGKDGKPLKDKKGKVIYEPYRIKVLNTINFDKSMHYNPFAYIHSEKDILKLVTTLIANTKGEGKAGDDF